MLRQIRKSMNLTLTFMLAVPAFILVLFSIINVDYMYVAGILALIFFVAFFCIFLVQKRKYNKVSKVIEKYMGVKDYILEEQKKEKEIRRKRYIAESQYHNKLDEIYFNEKRPEELPNDYMKKEQTGYQTLGGYIYSMNNNLFLESMNQYRKNRSLEEICLNAHVDLDILDLLLNPEYRISRTDAIKIVLALHLNLEEAGVLLAQAGYRLDKLREYDAAICYFIENKLYDIDYINLALVSIRFEEL